MEKARRFQDGYEELVAEDFRCPPTADTRRRVAAALATEMRDAAMLGKDPVGNFETLRAVLTATDEVWLRDIVPMQEAALEARWAFDTIDPFIRYKQGMG
jgi:hypothetical protein